MPYDKDSTAHLAANTAAYRVYCEAYATRKYVAWQDVQECIKAYVAATAVPECGTLSGETPRTDAAWKEAGSIYRDGEWQAFSPTEGKGWALARQLERELYDAQNDLGRFEESNRQAQETIDDLRQQLADAVSTSGTPYCWLDHDTMNVHFSLMMANQFEDVGHEIIPLYTAPLSARPLNNDTDTTGAKG